MASIKFYKVTSLPGTLEANAFYYVKESGHSVAGYLTDQSGTAYAINNADDVVNSVNGLDGDVTLDLSFSGGKLSLTGSNVNINLDLRYRQSADNIPWGEVDSTPTTLSGYGITDAYTKSDVDNITGSLSSLNTTQKDNLVKAINEVLGIVNSSLQPPQPLDASSSPDYPSASVGDTWKITKAGKVGGANGEKVEPGDMMIAIANSSGGSQSSVGDDFFFIQANVDNATESVTGLGRIATSQEIANGTDDFAWVTSKKLNTALGDYYTKAYLQGKDFWNISSADITKWNNKQDKLTAGSNITISGGTISATDTKYTNGTGLSLSSGKFSLDTATSSKLGGVKIGSGIDINNGVISVSGNEGGTVTSVGMSVPTSILSVSGSPITSSGTFSLSLEDQSANTVFAGPTSGGDDTPVFRSLVEDDIPHLPYLDRKDENFTDFDTLITGDEEEKFSVSTSSPNNAPTNDSGFWNTFTFFGGSSGNQLTINNRDGHIWLRHALSSTSFNSWRRVAELPDIKDSKITISPGTGLKTGGDFTLNQSSNKSITLDLDTATTSKLGGISVGDRLSVTDAGELSADKQDWDDIQGRPTIGDAMITFKINGSVITDNFTTNQGTNKTIDLGNTPNDNTQLSNEQVQDIIGNSLDTTLIYDDVNNKIGVDTSVIASKSWANGKFLTSETDPVFNASPAGGITSGDIANWNSALQSVDWGYIGGTLSNQTDLQNALNGKFDADYSNVADADIPNNTQNFVNVSDTTANSFGSYGSIISSMGATGYIQFGMARNHGLYERIDKGSWDRLATRPWVQSQNYLKSVDITTSLSGNTLTVSNSAGGIDDVDLSGITPGLATKSSPGIVQVGDRLSIDGSGVLSADKQSWNDINDKPTIGDGTVTFKINGSVITDNFTTNQGTNKTVDLGTTMEWSGNDW